MSDIPNMTANVAGSASHYGRTEIDLIALVDADFLKYYVTKAVYDWMQKHDGTDPFEAFGIDYLDHFIRDILDKQFFSRIDAKGWVFLFSDASKKTFRYHVGFEKEYKGNRKVSEDYMYDRKFEDMAEVIHRMRDRYTVFIKDGFEADDLVSVLYRKGTFIWTQDKDLKQIPGLHFDLKSNKLREVTPEESLSFLCYQLLVGDSVDNIPGYPGVGDVTARKLLAEMPSIKRTPIEIMKHYMKGFGITEGLDRFAETWMLVKLRSCRGAHLTAKFQRELDIINAMIENGKI